MRHGGQAFRIVYHGDHPTGMRPVLSRLIRYGDYLGLVATVCLVFFPVFLGRIIFMRDPAHWSFPLRWFLRKTWLDGRLPGWDPRQGLGFSLVSDPLLGAFYPPNLLYLLPDAARMVTFDSLLHLIWGGAGVITLLRCFEVRRSATFLGGVAWSLGGFTIGVWTVGLLLQAMSWIPWAGVAGVALARSALRGDAHARTARTIVLAALPTALALLQGEIFIATMGMGFALIMAVIVLFDTEATPTRPPLSRSLVRIGITAFAAFVLAGGLAAANLVPVALGSVGTERAGNLTRDIAELWSFHPLRLIEMVAPGAMGRPLVHHPGADLVGDPRVDGGFMSWSVYLGTSVVTLCLAAFGRHQRHRKLSVGLLIVALAAITLALGQHLPVHAVFRELVPPFGRMRYPEKYLIVFVTAIALLAGLGAHRVLTNETRVWRGAVIWLAFLCGLAFAHRLFPAPLHGPILGGTIYGACVAGCLTAIFALHPARRPILRVGLWIMVVLDLAVPTFAFVDFFSPDLPYRVPPAATFIQQHTTETQAPTRVYRDPITTKAISYKVPATSSDGYAGRHLLTLTPNAANIHGLAFLSGYDAAIPVDWTRIYNNGEVSARERLLVLSSTAFALMPDHSRIKPPNPEWLAPTDFNLLPGARLYRTKNPLPRVYAVGQTQPDTGQDAELFSDDVVRGEVVLIEDKNTEAHLSGTPGRAGTCTLDDYEDDRLMANCTIERDAMIVFVEQFAPGWTAHVGGTITPIHKVNRVMRGIRVPPGKHHIEMRYVPPGQALGVWVSLFAAISALGLAFLPSRRPPAV